jgi:ferredoxin
MPGAATELLIRPLSSPLLALPLLVLLEALRRAGARRSVTAAALAGLTVLGGGLHLAVCLGSPRASAWLATCESPFVAVLLLIVLPALALRRSRACRWFLLLPAAALAVAVVTVVRNCLAVPAGEWAWFLIRPGWLAAGAASLLVLVEPLLSLERFRLAVRLVSFAVLIWGGMIFRKDLADYRAAVARRPAVQVGVMNLSETSPVLGDSSHRTYLPSAPCRFTADGGYVQGCNLELAQRLMQVEWAGVAGRRTDVLGDLEVLFGATLLLLATSFILARWFCGWLCPLSFAGQALDWLRRLLRLPHLKPARPLKLAYLFSGAGLAGLTLAMARAYPSMGADGRFMGCKIPLYPFCKICPSQQLCPVVAGGPGAYAGLPSWAEWPFFRTAVLVLLIAFAASFALGRRLWCRLCPMGMLSGLFNRGGLVRLRKDAQKCNRCGVCADVCPMDIDLVRAEMRRTDVSSFDCVLCLECVARCPRDGCLSLEFAGAAATESRFGGEPHTAKGPYS